MAGEDSTVYFYYSGHGAPDLKTGQAYLVPWDGDAQFLKDTALPAWLHLPPGYTLILRGP